jgi:hypothetical protein
MGKKSIKDVRSFWEEKPLFKGESDFVEDSVEYFKEHRKVVIEDIIRLYDGINNPIGKAYTRNDFVKLLLPYFKIEKIFYHLFPARAFSFKIPKFFHRFLDRKRSFMIYVELKIRPSVL